MTGAAGRFWRSGSAGGGWWKSSVHDALDLVDGEGLAADRQQRRGLGEIDRADHALDLGRDSDRVACGVLGGSRELVAAVNLLRAVVALAVQVKGWLLPALAGKVPLKTV